MQNAERQQTRRLVATLLKMREMQAPPTTALTEARREKQKLREAIMNDMVQQGVEQRLDDGRIVRLTTRTVPRRIDTSRMRHLVVTAHPPSQNRAAAAVSEQYEDMEVSEMSSQPSATERLCMWLEGIVSEELLPKRQVFEIITPKRRRSNPTMPAHEIERYVQRLEDTNASIRAMRDPDRAQQAKELSNAAATLEPDVLEVLVRLGGCARYRIVHEGEETHASLYVCERQHKAPAMRARELHELMSDVVGKVVSPDSTFEELVDAWHNRALSTAVGDALAEAVDARNSKKAWVKRSVALRRNGVGE